eukprot:CAMPEP_0172308462 /NCGR_PEP_ID=MMETSP1058-20130122/9053_1 /TAXON_ID=83371 /ORGANISM="Detonula confervacea, Strain CCMP 353" /LENGTH=250 /DNA_ID=CAMNT_0013020885 /DNA_START=32 /DNA_END=781 /DNA_ORIENTATION=+
MEGKGKEIAGCLGYRHDFHDNDDIDNLVGDIGNSIVKSIEEPDAVGSTIGDSAAATEINAQDVDMWHLRSLAIQPGGLLNSHGRKLGWIKLAGVDDLVFNGEQANGKGGNGIGHVRIPADGHRTYEQIQKHLEQEMEPSKWHIQRERRRLRKERQRNNENSSTHASSTNDHSSIGSESGSSTPLAANLNSSHAGTPKSVTFHGIGTSSAGDPFNSSPNKLCKDSSPTSYTACPSLTVDTSLDTSIDSHNL